MRRLWTLAALACSAGCGDNLPPDPLWAMVDLTGDSPFSASCGLDATAPGTALPGVEVQPQLAVDPTKPAHLVAAWQQDRWSSGGARGIGTAASTDGGATWSVSYPHVGPCAGGSKPAAGYARATTPWLAFAADGTPWLSALAFDTARPRSAVVAARSTDGGKTWGDPAVVYADSDADVFDDRPTLTGDPDDANRLYLVWDRMSGLAKRDTAQVSSALYFTRRTAGAWEPARAIYDPGAGHQVFGAVLAVLADGTLLVAFDEITGLTADVPTNTLSVVTSSDRGDTWSGATAVRVMKGVGVTDPDGVPVRTGVGLPAIAVDRSHGAIYVAWEDQTSKEVEAIRVIRSADAGATWSGSVIANGDRTVPAFTPTIAVATTGAVGVTYYDLRDPTPFHASAWLATSQDNGATWADTALGLPFDLAPARVGDSYFLGDSQGLVASDKTFVPLFTGTHKWADGLTDIFARSAN